MNYFLLIRCIQYMLSWFWYGKKGGEVTLIKWFPGNEAYLVGRVSMLCVVDDVHVGYLKQGSRL